MNTTTFTRDQMLEAFKLIQDKKHWKNPIRSVCQESEIPLITEAIIYFTATTPEFTNHRVVKRRHGRFTKGMTICDVTAVGYFMGPAGP